MSAVDEARDAVWIAFEAHHDGPFDCDGVPETDALAAYEQAIRAEYADLLTAAQSVIAELGAVPGDVSLSRLQRAVLKALGQQVLL